MYIVHVSRKHAAGARARVGRTLRRQRYREVEEVKQGRQARPTCWTEVQYLKPEGETGKGCGAWAHDRLTTETRGFTRLDLTVVMAVRYYDGILSPVIVGINGRLRPHDH